MTLSPLLLALAEDEELPNYEAVARSPVVGWLFFAALLGLVAFFLAHRDSWRRMFLRADDPRPMAAMRIVFGLCALCNVNELSDQFIYLFTDEGIFPTDVAQHFRARQQFDGYGDMAVETEGSGFYTFGAFLEWLKGPNWSLLLFNSSPKFFWGYLAVFEVVMLLFIVGFQTKWMKWLAWFLYMGLILRNTLHWEATENVFRVFMFYLCLARCGEAWSIDNWLRCRRLRKQGRLSEPGKPGDGAGAPATDEHPAFEPIYRSIPAWPRMLVILNVAALYCATGVLKNGPVWWDGDAMYYAFNLDHFYRLPTQVLSAYFGTTLFKANTHVTHWWEILFPVVVLGLVLRWHRREGIAPLKGAALWTARLGLGGFCLAFYALCIYSWPVHYAPSPEGFSLFGLKNFAPEDSLDAIMWTAGIGMPVVAISMVVLYRWLRDRPPPEQRHPLIRWLDLDWVCRWLFGRRVWLVLGLVFHGHLILTMNIGWFSPGLISCYFAFMNGGELSHILAAIGRALHRTLRIPMPKHVVNYAPAPVADPRVSGVRDPVGKFPASQYMLGLPELLTAVALVVVGVLRRVQTDPDIWEAFGKVVSKSKVELPELFAQDPPISPNWFVGMVVVMVVIVTVRRMRGFAFNPWFGPVIVLGGWAVSLATEHEGVTMWWSLVVVAALSWAATTKPARPSAKADDEPAQPWAYGPLGRSLATLFTLYHIGAVISTQLPEKDSWSTFRPPVNDTFRTYLSTTQTSQGWGMFAPNPPRRNVFMRVMVTDIDGEVYDLNTDVYACFQEGATEDICEAVYPMPWIWYSRRGKMNRRIAGSEGGAGGWYQKWHARYICREWQREHGHLPQKVELYKVSYPIPTPEQVVGKPYDPKTQYRRKQSTTKLHTTECKGSPIGQMTDEVRERHGMGPAPEEEKFVPWNKNRCRTWEQRMIDEDIAKYGKDAVDVTDPKYDVCPDVPPVVRKALDKQEREEAAAEDAPTEERYLGD